MSSLAPEAGSDRQLSGKKILVLAPVGAYGGFNTSVHRVRALESLGGSVRVVDSATDGVGALASLSGRVRHRLFRLGLPVSIPDPGRDVARLLQAARNEEWQIVWLEKALTIGASALRALRAACPRALIVGFSPDDMYARHNQSRQFLQSLPFYDAFLTTKSYNVAELGRLGCPSVIFVGNGFDPVAFRPISVSPEDEKRLGGDVGFIGSFEPERAAAMLHLARQGIAVRVWGNGWQQLTGSHPNLIIEGKPLHGDDFAMACGALKVNLGFLRKLNRDQQTTRSVEIPACGGFLLAERTDEHAELFVEGVEAEFFDSLHELSEKCRHYLENPGARKRIAERGRARCVSAGYSNAGRLRHALARLVDTKLTHPLEAVA